MVQDTEDPGKEKYRVGRENVVGHLIPLVWIHDEDAVCSHAVVHYEQCEDPKVKDVPETHHVEGEPLLGEPH